MGIQIKPFDNKVITVKHEEWFIARFKSDLIVTSSAFLSSANIQKPLSIITGDIWPGKLSVDKSAFLIKAGLAYFPVDLGIVDVFFRKVTETTTINTTIVDVPIMQQGTLTESGD